jgi:hypothetical protein
MFLNTICGVSRSPEDSGSDSEGMQTDEDVLRGHAASNVRVSYATAVRTSSLRHEAQATAPVQVQPAGHCGCCAPIAPTSKRGI